MSKIARYAGNLPAFGSGAQGLERTVFGGTTQADDLTSQVTAAFLRGWGVVGPSENPSLEDFNAAFYTVSQLIAYQHQMGVPEWEVKQEYYVGSVCSYKGELYVSLSNSNTGNEPPSAQWTLVITVKNGISKLGLGTAAKKDVGTGTNQIPDMSYFASSQLFNGWQKMPGGLIWQYGGAGGVSAQTLYFPLQFPNNCFQVIAIADTTFAVGYSGNAVVNVSALTNTGFNCMVSNLSGQQASKSVHWMAIGN